MDDLRVDTDIEVGSRWEHLKSGGTYEVVAVARIEHDLSPVIVYKSEKDGLVWVRPHDEFADGRFMALELNAEQAAEIAAI